MSEIAAEYTREILKKVRQVEIRTNRLVNDALSGAYHSVFKGRGMDFEEVREYAPGDDVRSIDWNVTAKMDRPFVKKFREERELTIMIMVDLSASGDFGSVSESKREVAAELASVLAFSATRNNDKVGLVLFTNTVEKYIPAKKGRMHVLRLIREILFFEPTNKGTDVSGALQYLNRVNKRKAVVFMLTDLLQGPDGELPKLHEKRPAMRDAMLRSCELTHQHHDFIFVHMSDPRELELPAKLGVLTLEDAETGEQVQIDTHSARQRNDYFNTNRERLNLIEKTLSQHGIDMLRVSTDEPYINPLRKFLKKRMMRK